MSKLLCNEGLRGGRESADPRLQIQIAAHDGEGSCRAGDRSADPRLRIQIAARGGEGSRRANRRVGDRYLQIPDCKYRLQHAAERRAAVTAEREDEKNLRIQY